MPAKEIFTDENGKCIKFDISILEEMTGVKLEAYHYNIQKSITETSQGLTMYSNLVNRVHRAKANKNWKLYYQHNATLTLYRSICTILDLQAKQAA